MRTGPLLVSVALVAAGCASVTRVSGQGMDLGDVGRAVDAPVPARRTDRIGAFPPSSVAGPERASARLTRQAVIDTVHSVKGSMGTVTSALSGLAGPGTGFGRVNGVFSRHIVYASNQLPWLHGSLAGSMELVDAAVGIGEMDMELGVLQMTGPRLQAAMFGAILLTAWVDFLSLAEAMLRRCYPCSVEKLIADMNRVQHLIEPSMAALASQDSEQVEAAATAMPELMGNLTREFASIRNDVRVAMERNGQVMAAAQIVEMVTMVSAMKMSLARLPGPPAAPVTLGAALVMGSGGVMAGSRIVVSVEWVEMVRRLVQAGVLSLPAVSAAVRIHAGQVMMMEANGDLPPGVRDALGDGPEVRAMRPTGKAGAGMSEAPRHHVLPQEHRAWFEQRGFKGDMSIDRFCVRMERADHQAIHGGGNWRMGRTWPNEWSQAVMRTLRDAETSAGRMLTRNEILQRVALLMRRYEIPMKFIPGRRG